MQISSSFRNIGLSQIVAISEQARVLAPDFESRTNKPFIYFQRGEVGYPAPSFLAEAFAEAFAKGATKYPKSGGEPYFKDAVIKEMEASGVQGIDRDNIVATYGGQEGLQLVFSMFRGATVAGFTPCWSCMFDNLMPYTDCKFLPVPLNEEDGWSIDWDLLESTIQNADIFYFNSPHNPTGRVFTSGEIVILSHLCARYGVLLVCDDAYKELIYDNGTIGHYSPLYDRAFENIVVVNTFSKSLAATGLRIGYAVSRRKDLIERMTLGDYSQTAGVSTPTQYAVSKALVHPDRKKWLATFKTEMESRANVLAENLDLVFMSGQKKPQGAFYLFCPVPSTLREEHFVSRLMSAGIAVVPGSAFGTEGYVRLSFSTLSSAMVEKGAKRFSEVYKNAMGGLSASRDEYVTV